MEALVHWFSQNLSQYISPEGAVFIISMIPLLELRGGLLAASLLKISAAKAIPLCIVGKDVYKRQDMNVMDCVECRCCQYICSSKIPIINSIKAGKNAVRGMK